MLERSVSFEEIMLVIAKPRCLGQAAGFGTVFYEAEVRGRSVRVTMNALNNLVVTVVAEPFGTASSSYGWFSIGCSFEAKS